jgi:hypothetical protein
MMKGVGLIPVSATVFLVAALALLGCSNAVENEDLEEARSFRDFGVYYPGKTVAGLPLTGVGRSSVGNWGAKGVGQTYVSFIYGDCDLPEGEGGCAPPLQVFNEPACIYNLSRFEGQGQFGSLPEKTTIRGVPAAFFEGGSALDIQTGRTNISVFGRNMDDVRAVARALTSLNLDPPVRAGEPLPPPAPGAVEGKLACSTPSSQ